MKIVNNYSQNGIELYFPDRPSEETLDLLRGQNWRWHRVKKCWYNKDTLKNAQFADILLCMSLMEHLLETGVNYDNKDYRKTLSSLSDIVQRMKQRKTREYDESLKELSGIVKKYQTRDRKIEEERQAEAKAKRERNEELIQDSYKEFVRKAKSSYLRNADKFWSKYDKLIEFDSNTSLRCYLVIKNPDSNVASLEQAEGYVQYDRINIIIKYDLFYRKSGYVYFGSDVFEIQNSIVDQIVSKHIPDSTVRKIEKYIQNEIIKDVRRKGLDKENVTEKDQHYRLEENSLVPCRKCNQYIDLFRDGMCWDCYKEEMQSYDVD